MKRNEPPKAWKDFSTRYPDVAGAYDQLSEAARHSGPLDAGTVAVAKLAISIGGHIDRTVHIHAKKALRAGVEPSALRQVALIALPTIGLPATLDALRWIEESIDEESVPHDPVDLISHIVSRHHAYVRVTIPSIQRHFATIVAAHGQLDRAIHPISSRFDVLAADLALHMTKEEQLLFPYMRALVAASKGGTPPPPDMFGTIRNPIRMMEVEHQHATNELAAIRTLVSEHERPDDASMFRPLEDALRAFERDFDQHVHLENDLLFPRAIQIEEEIQQGQPSR